MLVFIIILYELTCQYLLLYNWKILVWFILVSYLHCVYNKSYILVSVLSQRRKKGPQLVLWNVLQVDRSWRFSHVHSTWLANLKKDHKLETSQIWSVGKRVHRLFWKASCCFFLPHLQKFLVKSCIICSLALVFNTNVE